MRSGYNAYMGNIKSVDTHQCKHTTSDLYDQISKDRIEVSSVTAAFVYVPGHYSSEYPSVFGAERARLR